MLPPDGITRPAAVVRDRYSTGDRTVSLLYLDSVRRRPERRSAPTHWRISGNGAGDMQAEDPERRQGSKGWGVFRVVPILAGCLGGWFAVEGAWPLHLLGLALGGLLALGVSFVLWTEWRADVWLRIDADEGGARHRLGLPRRTGSRWS
jgi:hypothetical protein